jgi:GNAT superfamily N-acetyltransferase
MSVRPLRSDDFPAWLQLWRGYLAFYRAELTDEQTELSFTRLCNEAQGMAGLVAVDENDRPIGLAHLVFHPATWSENGYCYLEDLYVDPKRRGGAVARELFAAVDRVASQRGADKVYWHTQQFNGAARSLYDTVGQLTSFVVYERPLG